MVKPLLLNKYFKMRKYFLILLSLVNINLFTNCKSGITLTPDTEIGGRVEYFDSDRGAVFLRLKGDTVEYAFRSSYNYDYNPYSIENFLQINDSILKTRNSDTIYIYRDTIKYYFIIGEIINKP
jgi:hypothetical protein